MQTILRFLAENWAVLIPFVITTVITIVAAYYGYRGYTSAHAHANRAARPSIKPFGIEPTEDTVYALPFLKETVFIVPLPLYISNTGDISARNVEIFLSLPEEIYGRDIPRQLSAIASACGWEHATEEGRNEHITEVYFQVGDISPDVTVQILPTLIARGPTQRPFDVLAQTKDNKQVRIIGKVDYAFEVTARLTYTDGSPVESRIKLAFIEGTADRATDLLREEAARRDEIEDQRPEVPSSLALIAFKNFVEELFHLPSGEQIRVQHADHRSRVVATARIRLHEERETS